MAAALGPPSIALLRSTSSLSSLSDSAALHNDLDHSVQPRFPHTRAQLAAIARLYKPDAFAADAEADPSNIISSSLVSRVAALLDGEREDDIKHLLKDMFGPMSDDEVCCRPSHSSALTHPPPASARAARPRPHAQA